MFTNAKLALCVAAMLGSTSAAQTAPQRPTIRQTESIAPHQVSRSAPGDDSFAPAPGQNTRASAVYFDPSPAPFNAFTYCASVLLTPSTSKRVVQGEFRFPAFSATPNVSVQIISSIGGAPMQVHALKIQETPGISGGIETHIVVEAQTLFDVSRAALLCKSRSDRCAGRSTDKTGRAKLLIESKLCHRPGRRSPDMCRYNVIIGAGQGIWREVIC